MFLIRIILRKIVRARAERWTWLGRIMMVVGIARWIRARNRTAGVIQLRPNEVLNVEVVDARRVK